MFTFLQPPSEDERTDARSRSSGESSRKSSATFRISTASSAISTTSSSRSIRSSSQHVKKRWKKVQRSYVPVEYEVIFFLSSTYLFLEPVTETQWARNLKKSRQKSKIFFRESGIFGSLKHFSSSKIDFWLFLKLRKMEFGQKKFVVKLIYLTSWIFLAWTFFKGHQHCKN